MWLNGKFNKTTAFKLYNHSDWYVDWWLGQALVEWFADYHSSYDVLHCIQKVWKEMGKWDDWLEWEFTPYWHIDAEYVYNVYLTEWWRCKITVHCDSEIENWKEKIWPDWYIAVKYKKKSEYGDYEVWVYGEQELIKETPEQLLFDNTQENGNN